MAVKSLETTNIHGVHVFSAGTWTDSSGKKHTYTEQDIADMASANNELTKLRAWGVPLKFGHEKNKLADGAPALGWLENFVAVGGKLYADFVRVPKRVAELIRVGAYAKRSAEIIGNYTVEAVGKTYRLLVSGLALLGANLPALSNLESITGLYDNAVEHNADDRRTYEFPADAPDDVDDTTKKSTEEFEMENKELLALIEKNNERLTKLEVDNATYAARTAEAEKRAAEYKSELDTLKAEKSEIEKKQVDDSVQAFAAAIETKTPQKDIREVLVATYSAIVNAGAPATFSAADGSKQPLAEAFSAAITGLSDHGAFKETAEQTGAKGEAKKMRQHEFSAHMDRQAEAMGIDLNTAPIADHYRVKAAVEEKIGKVEIAE